MRESRGLAWEVRVVQEWFHAHDTVTAGSESSRAGVWRGHRGVKPMDFIAYPCLVQNVLLFLFSLINLTVVQSGQHLLARWGRVPGPAALQSGGLLCAGLWAQGKQRFIAWASQI